MSPRTSDARQRMLDSASDLIREQGASAPSVDDILVHSRAPRGSVYHYFPGGRSQLIREAVERAGGSVEQLIRQAGDVTPVEVFDIFVAQWREQLAATELRSGCPVLAAAIESRDETPGIVEAAGRAFAGWRRALTTLLVHHGHSRAQARRLSNLIVAAVEGAVVLARAESSMQPIDDVSRALRPLLTSHGATSTGQ